MMESLPVIVFTKCWVLIKYTSFTSRENSAAYRDFICTRALVNEILVENSGLLIEILAKTAGWLSSF